MNKDSIIVIGRYLTFVEDNKVFFFAERGPFAHVPYDSHMYIDRALHYEVI